MKRTPRILMKITLFMVAVPLIGVLLWRMVPAGATTPRSTNYLDLHVHTAGLGYGDSGAFINTEMADSYKFPIYLWAMGVTEDELIEHGDGVVIEKLAAKVGESTRVGSAIILAMDGVIDRDGQLDRDRTQIYVPNEFVAAETAKYTNLEFGGSVNPNRQDAVERLQTTHAMGAKLIKWIPNIMHIDPADEAHTAFYREMAALQIPLLSHAGQERSFAGAQDEYGDPQRLRLPLELGVTVIAAHIATTGENGGEDNYARILPMFDDYPNLYTEISSLTQLNKLNYLADALQQTDLEARLLYGTDWPLQFFPLVSPVYHLNHIDLLDAKAIADIDNQWDRDVLLKEAMGVPESVFIRTRRILDM